jgi:anti-sigma factor ChrR (cupin superfamily)
MDEPSEQQQAAQDEILRLAATAEQGSDHPLSRAILDAARWVRYCCGSYFPVRPVRQQLLCIRSPFRK